MVIITKRILNAFGRQHADAAEALNDWYKTVENADWKSLNDVRRQFNSVDYVGNERFVFNIRGNNYRLGAMIFSTNARCTFVSLVPTLNMTELMLQPSNFFIMNRIDNEEQYQQVMALIETYLQKVTTLGSFSALTSEEADELARLSKLAEVWEDSIPLMPIPLPPPQNRPSRVRVADSR